MNTNEVAVPVEISDIALEDVNINVINAANYLKAAAGALRNCYIGADSDNQKYKDLRRSITNNAVIYEGQIQPFSQNIIRNLQNLTYNYSELEYEDFKKFVSEIAGDVHKYRLQAELVARMHECILKEFKNVESRAMEVIETLRKPETSSSNSLYDSRGVIGVINWMWYQVSNSSTNTESSNGHTSPATASAIAIAASENAELAKFAADIINVLTKSLQGFVEAMIQIANFFSIIELEICRVRDQNIDAATKRHYEKIKVSAMQSQQSCRYYLAILPDVKTDLDAIETKDIDENYVQKWLEEAMVKIDKEEKSIVDWVIEILPEGTENLFRWLNNFKKGILRQQ